MDNIFKKNWPSKSGRARGDFTRLMYNLQTGQPSDNPIAAHRDQTKILEKAKNIFLSEQAKENISGETLRITKNSETMIKHYHSLERVYDCLHFHSEYKKLLHDSEIKLLSTAELDYMLKHTNACLQHIEDLQQNTDLPSLHSSLADFTRKTLISMYDVKEEEKMANTLRKRDSYYGTVIQCMEDLYTLAEN